MEKPNPCSSDQLPKRGLPTKVLATALSQPEVVFPCSPAMPSRATLPRVDHVAPAARTAVKSCAWRANGCLSCRPSEHEGRTCGHVPVVPVIMSWWHMQPSLNGQQPQGGRLPQSLLHELPGPIRIVAGYSRIHTRWETAWSLGL